MTRTEYKLMWDRFQRRQEAIYTRVFKSVLKQQLQEYFDRGDISAYPMQLALENLYNNVGPLWAAKTGVARKKPIFIKARLPMGFSERIVQLMREYYGNVYFLNEAEEITRYTRERIAFILGDAALTGFSIDEIIEQFPADFGAVRARRIARTETVTSANTAALINARDTGIPMQKIWLSVRDRRTRHSHVIADNTTVGLDDYFKVGSVEIESPGAKKTREGQQTPGKEVINCRCTQGFRIIK